MKEERKTKKQTFFNSFLTSFFIPKNYVICLYYFKFFLITKMCFSLLIFFEKHFSFFAFSFFIFVHFQVTFFFHRKIVKENCRRFFSPRFFSSFFPLQFEKQKQNFSPAFLNNKKFCVVQNQPKNSPSQSRKNTAIFRNTFPPEYQKGI